jgi:hypothetical protein
MPLRSSEAKELREATDKEVKELRDNMTFELVKRICGNRVINVNWCFKKQRSELGQVVRTRFVVAKGFTKCKKP